MNIFLLNPRIQEEIKKGDAGDYVEEDFAETGLFIMVSKAFEKTSLYAKTSHRCTCVFDEGCSTIYCDTKT